MAGFTATPPGTPGSVWQGAGGGGWTSFEPGGGFNLGDNNIVSLPGGSRQIVLPKLPGGFGDKIINTSLGSPVGGGDFFDPQGRDPRPGPGGILGPIGNVGPSNYLDWIFEAVKAAIFSGDVGKVITDQVKAIPKDENGVPIIENVPGVEAQPDPGDPTPGDPGTTEPGDGEAGEPVTPDPPGTEPAEGDDMADPFFNIGRPNEQNQFSASKEQHRTELGPGQAELMQQLIPQFQQLANQQSQQIQGIAPGLAQSLGGQGQGFLSQLGQGANPFLQQLMQFQGANQAPQAFGGQGTFQQLAQGGGALGEIAAGQNQLQQSLVSQGPNEFLNPAIDQLGADINQQLQRQNVGIGQNAAMAGARGGSRQGVAEGIAQEAALETFGRQAGQIRAQDAAQQRQLQQSGQLGALQAQIQGGQLQQGGQLGGAAGLQGGGQFNAAMQQQGQQQGLNALTSGAGGQNQLLGVNQGGAAAGLGQLGNLFNLGLGQFSAARSPFTALAGLFDPVTLASGEGVSSGQNSGSGGFNFGIGGL